MHILNVILTWSLWLGLTVSLPPSIYDGGCHQNSAPIKLRIGNGGAGQSGLVEKLSNEFIKNQTNDCTENPFRIEWVLGDTTITINNLKLGKADVGITYNTAAEMYAIEHGIADGCDQCATCDKYNAGISQSEKDFCGTNRDCKPRPCDGFLDHFYFVGPKKNLPDEQKLQPSDDILAMLSKVYTAAEEKHSRVSFLSRYDKSATNIKDSELWIKIGQVPWANTRSRWYHQYPKYPVQALKEAIRRQDFTITDRGTHLTLRAENPQLTDQIKIYKSAVDEEELLNPGHVLVGRNAKDKTLARSFVDWVQSIQGQEVIANFNHGDGCLYKPYVDEVRPKECRFTLEEMSEKVEL